MIILLVMSLADGNRKILLRFRAAPNAVHTQLPVSQELVTSYFLYSICLQPLQRIVVTSIVFTS
jgi:hypothetical protein